MTRRLPGWTPIDVLVQRLRAAGVYGLSAQLLVNRAPRERIRILASRRPVRDVEAVRDSVAARILEEAGALTVEALLARPGPKDLEEEWLDEGAWVSAGSVLDDLLDDEEERHG